MSYFDDLEVNPFYNHALNRQTYLQQILCDGSILCVPTINTLPSTASTERFLDLHILKPSRLYKGEFSTIWSNVNGEHQTVSWDEHKYTLTAVYGGTANSVEVLYSETAYIQGVKYTVLLIERPLNVLQSEVDTFATSSRQHMQVNKIDIEKTSLHDMQEFLRLANIQNIEAVDKDIKLFQSKYLVLPSFLPDAALKLDSIANKYADGLLNSGYNKQAHTALLSYIHHQTFSHVYPVVKLWKEGDDLQFLKQCVLMEDAQIMVGSSDIGDIDVSEISQATSPLQLLSLFKLTLDAICSANVVRPIPYPSKGPVSSDELIPMLIGVLISKRGINFPSLLKFTQVFGASLMDFQDAFEFSLATFTAAVQYILDYSFSSDSVHAYGRATTKGSKQSIARKAAHRSAADGSRVKDVSTKKADDSHEFGRPFRYSSVNGDDDTVLDRYALLSILRNCGKC